MKLSIKLFLAFVIINTTPLTYSKATLSELYQQAGQCYQNKKYDQAIELYKQALHIAPNLSGLANNIGLLFKMTGKYYQAIPYYERAIILNPENETAHFGLGKTCLAIGNFTRGWELFEWRMADYKNYKKKFIFHDMQPQDIAGKTILIRAEFGLGDTIQFIRYVWELKKAGARSIDVETFGPLVDLFSQCDYIDHIFKKGNPPARPYDVQIPLLSLPLFFKTTKNTIPADVPYLQADDNLVNLWKEKLNNINPDKNVLNVGICWQASPQTFLEDNPLTKRSVPLALFESLAHLKNVKLYSLQQFDGLDQLDNLPNNFGIHIFDKNFDRTHGRFMDTAAVIKNLDLVITVDTAIAHLAGALATPTWLLIPSVAEWRWLMKGDTTPWYPKTKLFRQTKHNDWTSVIEIIKNQLEILT
ncbi:glycosyltransferase family protein [bacterium]|nr:glycosyltransferase family protein [bacterium]